jgi:hypothetical protein
VSTCSAISWWEQVTFRVIILYHQMSTCSAISWWEHVTVQWDEDEDIHNVFSPWYSWTGDHLVLKNDASKCNMFSTWYNGTGAHLVIKNDNSKCNVFSPRYFEVSFFITKWAPVQLYHGENTLHFEVSFLSPKTE